MELNGEYGYIDLSGQEVIPKQYDDVGDFYEGRAIVELNGREFTIDKNGKEIE